MAISVGTRNKLQVALKNAAAAAEICDRIDITQNLTQAIAEYLYGVTPGTVTASKALVVDADGALDSLKITTLTSNSILSGANNGVAVSANSITADEYGDGVIHKTVLTFAGSIDILNDAGTGFGNLKLYDFPAGRILILGMTADISVYWGADANLTNTGSGDFSLGTTGTSDTTLNGTDVNLLPSTGMTDPFVAGLGDANGALAASAQFDGTSTAIDAYLNMIVDNGDISNDASAELSGTVTITWINLGDY